MSSSKLITCNVLGLGLGFTSDCTIKQIPFNNDFHSSQFILYELVHTSQQKRQSIICSENNEVSERAEKAASLKI